MPGRQRDHSAREAGSIRSAITVSAPTAGIAGRPNPAKQSFAECRPCGVAGVERLETRRPAQRHERPLPGSGPGPL